MRRNLGYGTGYACVIDNSLGAQFFSYLHTFNVYAFNRSGGTVCSIYVYVYPPQSSFGKVEGLKTGADIVF